MFGCVLLATLEMPCVRWLRFIIIEAIFQLVLKCSPCSKTRGSRRAFAVFLSRASEGASKILAGRFKYQNLVQIPDMNATSCDFFLLRECRNSASTSVLFETSHLPSRSKNTF